MLHQSLGAYISVSVYTSLSTSLDSSSLGVNHCSLFWLMFIELKQKREAHQRIKAEERGAAKYEDSTGDQYVYIHGSWDRGRLINEGRFLKKNVSSMTAEATAVTSHIMVSLIMRSKILPLTFQILGTSAWQIWPHQLTTTHPQYAAMWRTWTPLGDSEEEELSLRTLRDP